MGVGAWRQHPVELLAAPRRFTVGHTRYHHADDGTYSQTDSTDHKGAMFGVSHHFALIGHLKAVGCLQQAFGTCCGKIGTGVENRSAPLNEPFGLGAIAVNSKFTRIDPAPASAARLADF